MIISGQPGEVGFKALIRDNTMLETFRGMTFVDNGWVLTLGYFFTKEEVEKAHPNKEYKWPVDVQADERVYVPTVSELTEGV